MQISARWIGIIASLAGTVALNSCGSDDSPAAPGGTSGAGAQGGSGGAGGSQMGGSGSAGTGGGGTGGSMAGDASQDANASDANTAEGGTMIGPQGGEVLGPGGAKLTIPAGALAASTDVRIVEASDAPPLRADAKVVGRTLAFLPHGLTFAVPATVHFPFDTAAAGQDVPRLFWAEQGKPWTVLTDATSAGGALEAQITHLSWGEPVVPVWQPHVSTAGGYTCALGASGSIWCWGWGPDVGPGGIERPTRLDQNGGVFMSIGVHQQYGCGIDSSGSVWCWGTNSFGRLGDGTMDAHPMPAKIASTLRFISLAVGYNHACAITGTTAELYCWGHNLRGQLGDGTNGSNMGKLVPTKVSTPPVRWASVSAGGQHTCATTDTSELYCWGDNVQRQLGIGNTPDLVSVPTKVALSAQSVSANGTTTCALSNTGLGTDSDAYCWGETTNGRIGNGVASPVFAHQPTPVKVVGGLSWKSIAAGGYTTCGVTKNSRVYCFGDNSRGGLGNAATGNSGTPVEIQGLPDSISVSAHGIGSACATSNLLDVWCWGDQSSGALGTGPADNMPHPTPVKIPLN
jgi:hypothetical protein